MVMFAITYMIVPKEMEATIKEITSSKFVFDPFSMQIMDAATFKIFGIFALYAKNMEKICQLKLQIADLSQKLQEIEEKI